MRLRIALVQQDTTWHAPAVNLARAAEAIASAADAGARVVALTELYATGFTMEPGPFAEPIPGPGTAALAEIARARGVWVVGTGIEAHHPRPRNAAFALSPDGALAAVYRKIHPFGAEREHYDGGDEVPVFDLDGVRASLQICYDLRFPEPFRAAAAAGAELVFVPANWPSARVAHWETLLAARAIENQLAVCGINRVGADPTLTYPGRSVIHDARGEVLARGDDRPGLVLAEVDFAEVRAWRERFPSLRDRRPDLYARLGRDQR